MVVKFFDGVIENLEFVVRLLVGVVDYYLDIGWLGKVEDYIDCVFCILSLIFGL